ncbi:HlyD family secretion protein [Falsiruegeria mediterranea]|jgi:multidrug resistance efflux pump|uniref:Inner membrane protein YibH n=1 Tax=Falsiruegeria mediterranea M17 TaxID=1200281 RepID=A0A2R8CDU6_9RHOB|nr:HlyD family secretion protein [Falsiruegeria mediterranea]SPJ30549.1 Inner membrane protein YibH [Falsiruegeria mediterranea M17]
MRKTIWSTLAVILIFLIWYLAADRQTPFTGNARVKAIATQIVPQVTGTVTEVLVENGQIVEAGDVLVRIDRRPYEIAKSKAEADLESATQDVGASSAEVSAAQAKLARAQSDLDTIRIQSERVFALEKKGLVPISQADNARGQLAESVANFENAQADLEKAKQRLGSEGSENPKIQRALAALAEAELDLEWTELRAPATGVVSNLLIAPGTYARSGQDLLTFLDATDIWIEAYFTENNLGRTKIGSTVEVVLDMHPGRVLPGVIESFSAAVSVSGGDVAGDLASAPSTKGFLREPERFPVRIVLPGYEAGNAEDDLRFQLNGQADVIMYLGDNGLLNMVGRAYIRLVSIMTYAY